MGTIVDQKTTKNSEETQKIVICGPKSAQIGLKKNSRTIEKADFLGSKNFLDPKKSTFSMVRNFCFRPIWVFFGLQIAFFCLFWLFFVDFSSKMVKYHQYTLFGV